MNEMSITHENGFYKVSHSEVNSHEGRLTFYNNCWRGRDNSKNNIDVAGSLAFLKGGLIRRRFNPRIL